LPARSNSAFCERDKIRINPNAGVRVETVAQELPVLIIDDFYLDPDEVRAEALGASYDLSIAYYPGRHATISGLAVQTVIGHVCRILNAVGDVVYSPEAFLTDFSIVTTRPADLLAEQKHPHIDPTPILGLVYLNPSNPIGTSFYENMVMQTRCIRSEADATRLTEFLKTDGKLHEPPGYDLSGSAFWRKYYTIEGRYNRLVIYPGNFFHAIDMQAFPDKLEIEEARLTQRFICQTVQQIDDGVEPAERRT
jgi:hypothetical protein